MDGIFLRDTGRSITRPAERRSSAFDSVHAFRPSYRAQSRSLPHKRDLPTLYQPQPFESASAGPAYLVTEVGTNVALRQLPLYEGKNRWSVDQLSNPDSTVFRHGGLYGDNILLHGEVRTAYKTTVATRLQRAFDAAVRKHFVKVRAFYVGCAAVALLDTGWRLTAAQQSPSEYDLRR